MQQEVGRVLVAMSGGVDSSVAAALLKEAGHDVVGVTLHLWDAQGKDMVGRCCAPEDRDDARRSCEQLGVPHYVVDERAMFRRDVVEPFLDSYLSGETPSPCVHCNQQVKLGQLARIADELGASHIATGHYARIEHLEGGKVRLLRGKDPKKDQSYFLYGVGPEVLRRFLFPLGGFVKDETRMEGKRLGVPNWQKPDSQELCFVPDGDIGGFVERQRALTSEGPIVDEAGQELGRHQGVYRYTVGQRRGIGLGGQSKPKYVLKILPEDNAIVVGSKEALKRSSVSVERVVWTTAQPTESFDAQVQVRYRHRAAPARVTPTEFGFQAEFSDPQLAVAPGQAAVVYRGDEVIGGGLLRHDEKQGN